MLDRDCQFSIVPLSLLKEDLSPTAINVYAAIDSFQRDGKANPGIIAISRVAGMSKPTTIKRILELEHLGYLKVERKNEPQNQQTNKYVIVFRRGLNKLPCQVKPVDRGSKIDDVEQVNPVDRNHINNNHIYKGRKKTPPFIPPTIEELAEFAETLAPRVEEDKKNDVLPADFDIDLGYFINYYTARDWTFNSGAKMKDWKATFKMWIARARSNHKPKDRFVVKSE